MRMRKNAARQHLDPHTPPPLTAIAERQVRFQEVDLLRVVWHGRYVDYFEDGRCAVGKAYGIDYPDFFREEIMAPIVRLHIEYQHFLLPGEEFLIETSLHWSEAVRLNYFYELKRKQDGKVVANGHSVQLLTDKNGQVFLTWPDYFQELRKRWLRGELHKK